MSTIPSQRKILTPKSRRQGAAKQPSEEPIMEAIMEEPTTGQASEAPVDPDSDPHQLQAFIDEFERLYDEGLFEEGGPLTEEPGEQPLAEAVEGQNDAQPIGQASQLQSDEDRWLYEGLAQMAPDPTDAPWEQSEDEPTFDQPNTQLGQSLTQLPEEMSQQQLQAMMEQPWWPLTEQVMAPEVEQQINDQLAQDFQLRAQQAQQAQQAAEELESARMDLDGRTSERVLGIDEDVRQHEAQIPEEVCFRIKQLVKERILLHTNIANLQQQVGVLEAKAKAEKEARDEADSVEQDKFLDREEAWEQQLAEKDEEIEKVQNLLQEAR
ncbi:MAG: hypothetical protein Q9157_001850 [Trypethelium eluteriae]